MAYQSHNDCAMEEVANTTADTPLLAQVQVLQTQVNALQEHIDYLNKSLQRHGFRLEELNARVFGPSPTK